MMVRPTITHRELQRLGRLFLTSDMADLRDPADQRVHEWLNAHLAAAYAAEMTAGLTRQEQVGQAARCSCHGTDDMCPCQNRPDAETLKQRGEA